MDWRIWVGRVRSLKDTVDVPYAEGDEVGDKGCGIKVVRFCTDLDPERKRTERY